jgi:hypothetical protein
MAETGTGRAGREAYPRRGEIYRQRLIKRLGKIDRAAMKRVDDAIRISLGLTVL